MTDDGGNTQDLSCRSLAADGGNRFRASYRLSSDQTLFTATVQRRSRAAGARKSRGILSAIRASFVLRRIATNVIPRGPGPNEDMHTDLDAGIAIHAAQRNAMDLAVVGAAKGGPAFPAELQSPSRRGLNMARRAPAARISFRCNGSRCRTAFRSYRNYRRPP